MQGEPNAERRDRRVPDEGVVLAVDVEEQHHIGIDRRR